jgi:hypothetical protein
MRGSYPNDLEELAERVQQHLEAENMYVNERMEAFEKKRQLWLTEAIRSALLNINGWVDERLIEPIKNFLLRRGF